MKLTDAVRVTDLSPLIAQFKAVWQGVTGWFSPGEPVPPVQAEPEPRARQMQVGFNLLWAPRGTEATSFDTLRFFASHYDIARIAIQTLKDEVSGIEWDIVARDEGSGDSYQEEIARARRFFERPDRVHDWPAWLSMLLEDRLVIDAATVYPRPNRAGGLYALEVVDGALIKPLVDARGAIPEPPAPAYQQVLWGVPRGMFTARQLLYLPQNVRTNSVYGFSELEGVVYIVNLALRKRLKDLSHFTEGNIPSALLGTPAEWTPDQIQQFQEAFDAALAGDLARRSRLIFVPTGARGSGLSIHEFTPFTGDPQFDEWLMKLTLAALRVTPADIGFTDDVNRASSEGQENVQYRRGLRPLMRWVKSLVDRVLADYLGCPQLQLKWLVEEHEDKVRQAQVDETYNKLGAVQIDEIREALGREPFGLPPFITTPQGLLFVEEIIAQYRRRKAAGWRDGGSTPGGAPGGPGEGPEPAEDVPAQEQPPEPPSTPPQLPPGQPEPEGAGQGEPEGAAGAPPGVEPAADGEWNPNESAWKSADGEPAPDNLVLFPNSPASGEPDLPTDEDRRRAILAARDDLRRWRTVAMKAVRQGQPVRAFRSDRIPLPVYKAVRDELDGLGRVAASERPLVVQTTFAKALRVLEEAEEQGRSGPKAEEPAQLDLEEFAKALGWSSWSAAWLGELGSLEKQATPAAPATPVPPAGSSNPPQAQHIAPSVSPQPPPGVPLSPGANYRHVVFQGHSGHWVTIHGHPVFIRDDGSMVHAGPQGASAHLTTSPNHASLVQAGLQGTFTRSRVGGNISHLTSTALPGSAGGQRPYVRIVYTGKPYAYRFELVDESGQIVHTDRISRRQNPNLTLGQVQQHAEEMLARWHAEAIDQYARHHVATVQAHRAVLSQHHAASSPFGAHLSNLLPYGWTVRQATDQRVHLVGPNGEVVVGAVHSGQPGGGDYTLTIYDGRGNTVRQVTRQGTGNPTDMRDEAARAANWYVAQAAQGGGHAAPQQAAQPSQPAPQPAQPQPAQPQPAQPQPAQPQPAQPSQSTTTPSGGAPTLGAYQSLVSFGPRRGNDIIATGPQGAQVRLTYTGTGWRLQQVQNGQPVGPAHRISGRGAQYAQMAAVMMLYNIEHGAGINLPSGAGAGVPTAQHTGQLAMQHAGVHAAWQPPAPGQATQAPASAPAPSPAPAPTPASAPTPQQLNRAVVEHAAGLQSIVRGHAGLLRGSWQANAALQSGAPSGTYELTGPGGVRVQTQYPSVVASMPVTIDYSIYDRSGNLLATYQHTDPAGISDLEARGVVYALAAYHERHGSAPPTQLSPADIQAATGRLPASLNLRQTAALATTWTSGPGLGNASAPLWELTRSDGSKVRVTYPRHGIPSSLVFTVADPSGRIVAHYTHLDPTGIVPGEVVNIMYNLADWHDHQSPVAPAGLASGGPVVPASALVGQTSIFHPGQGWSALSVAGGAYSRHSASLGLGAHAWVTRRDPSQGNAPTQVAIQIRDSAGHALAQHVYDAPAGGTLGQSDIDQQMARLANWHLARQQAQSAPTPSAASTGPAPARAGAQPTSPADSHLQPGDWVPPAPRLTRTYTVAEKIGRGTSSGPSAITIDHSWVASHSNQWSSVSGTGWRASYNQNARNAGDVVAETIHQATNLKTVASVTRPGYSPGSAYYTIDVYDQHGNHIVHYDTQAERSLDYIRDRAAQVANWAVANQSSLAPITTLYQQHKSRVAANPIVVQFAPYYAHQPGIEHDDPQKAAAYLATHFPRLVGLQQHAPHGGLDPIQHTTNVVGKLDTTGLSEVDAQLLKLAALFHDVGKQHDAYDHEHPRKSADDALAHLWRVEITDGGKKRKLTKDEVADVRHIIKWHDAIGDAIYKPNLMPLSRLANIAGNDRMAELLTRASVADSNAIPGFAGPQVAPAAQRKLQEVKAEIARLRAAGQLMPVREDVTPPPPAGVISNLVATDKQTGKKLKWGEYVQKADKLLLGEQTPYGTGAEPPKEVYDEARANPDLSYARAFGMAYDGPTGRIVKVYHNTTRGALGPIAATGLRPGSVNAYGWGVYTTTNGTQNSDPGYGDKTVVAELHTGRVVSYHDLTKPGGLVDQFKQAAPLEYRRLQGQSSAVEAAAALYFGYSTISEKLHGNSNKRMFVIVDPARIRLLTMVDRVTGKGERVTVNGQPVQMRDLTPDEKNTQQTSEHYVRLHPTLDVPEGYHGQARTS